MRLLLHWLITAAAIALAAYVLPGIQVDGFMAALVAAVVLGLINAVIRPLFLVLTLPLNILTLGLFTLVINAGMVLLAAKFVPGFFVSGFWAALLFSVLVSLFGSILGSLMEGSGTQESRM